MIRKCLFIILLPCRYLAAQKNPFLSRRDITVHAAKGDDVAAMDPGSAAWTERRMPAPLARITQTIKTA